MRPFRIAAVVGIAIGMALAAGCGKGHIDEGTVISFLYSTDTRGKLEGCGCQKSGGGITKRAAHLETARERDETILYIDAGNFLSGTPEVDESKGEAMVAAYNQMKPAAVNVSERELAYGMETFRRVRELSKFPYVSANIRYNGNAVADPYVIKKVKNANVAIMGLCGTKEVMRTDSEMLPSGVTVLDPVATAHQLLPVLAGKADVIVVLSTCGDAVDSVLARDFQMINLIAGGRSYRPNAESPWVIGDVRIGRAGHDGRMIGRVDMVFGPERRVKTYSATALTMEVGSPSSQKMLAVVREYVPGFADNAADGVHPRRGMTAGGGEAALTP